MSPASPPAATSRPLSPHLQVYRWQWTMALSILHRATGLFLSLGAVYLVLWLASIAAGPDTYAAMRGFNASIIGRLLLLAWTVSLFYHLCNGLRHLAWDAGWGLDLRTSYITAWLVVIGTATLTLASWIVAYLVRG